MLLTFLIDDESNTSKMYWVEERKYLDHKFIYQKIDSTLDNETTIRLSEVASFTYNNFSDYIHDKTLELYDVEIEEIDDVLWNMHIKRYCYERAGEMYSDKDLYLYEYDGYDFVVLVEAH